MTLILTFDQTVGAFRLVVEDGGQVLSALQVADLAVLEHECHHHLIRMRHLARGKVFEVQQPRSDA